MAILTITKDNFSKEVMESAQPVLLDFWANWCGPCRMLSPIIDEIGEETAGIKVGKVNVDEQRELAAQFGVMSIPTLVVIKNGKAVKRSVGVQTKIHVGINVPPFAEKASGGILFCKHIQSFPVDQLHAAAC